MKAISSLPVSSGSPFSPHLTHLLPPSGRRIWHERHTRWDAGCLCLAPRRARSWVTRQENQQTFHLPANQAKASINSIPSRSGKENEKTPGELPAGLNLISRSPPVLSLREEFWVLPLS